MSSAVQHKALPRTAAPEDAGVSSREVLAFLDDVQGADLELHSFMVLRRGHVAAECFFAPFTAGDNHQMWSVSKSVTATAVGIAIGEGLLTLNTRLLDIFPEYRPKRPDENLERLTVRDLVSMRSGKSPPYLSPKGDKADWLRKYVAAPWYNTPGTEFRYINENFYVLCAILTRVTGQSVIEYLTPRLFEPLGIERPFWETDAHGIESGGWGFYAKTEDLAKLILCYEQCGKFNGRQVIPAEWAREATRQQTPCVGLHTSTNHGYGYGFWMNPLPDSYRANGMFCQFGIAFPAWDGIFVCNASVTDEETVHQLAWKHFPKAFIDEAEETVPGFAARLHEARFEEAPPVSEHSELEAEIAGKTIRLRRKQLLRLINFPVGILPAIVTAKTHAKSAQINNIVLHFDENSCRFAWREGAEQNEVSCGMDGSRREGYITLGGVGYRTLSHAVWEDKNTLLVQIRAAETIACQRLRFRFRGGSRVTLQSKSTPPMEHIIGFLTDGAVFLFKNPVVLKALRWVLGLLPRVVEPVHHGRVRQRQIEY
ncbi:MAG: beta-lactamase family protein [Oscillospiraceae bacterium]|jgi:CubicO group peptidase (beta-lactamase class C family)|nr:beta-lactamase family protein [Oscillospiraceae bacterium]